VWDPPAEAHLRSGSALPAAQSRHPSASPFIILYVPLADPYRLKKTNPGPFTEFLKEFTQRAPGDAPKTVFSARDLDDGWGINAHDAMMTAGSAIRQADSNSEGPPPSREDILISLRQFQAGSQITGAVTLTNMDRNGNPKLNAPPEVLQFEH
jgi:hypothetical protein